VSLWTRVSAQVAQFSCVSIRQHMPAYVAVSGLQQSNGTSPHSFLTAREGGFLSPVMYQHPPAHRAWPPPHVDQISVLQNSICSQKDIV
jgi:hypothetical protein